MAAVDLAADLAAVALAADFAAVTRPVVLLAAVLLAAVALAADFAAVARPVVALVAAVLRGAALLGVLLLGVLLLGVPLLAVLLLAVVRVVEATRVPVVLVAEAAARAVDAAALAGAVAAVLAALPARAVTARAVDVAETFLAPLTMSLNPCPGRNFGTEVFASRTGAPVAGLRAVRAFRSTFSKTPKPVMPTFSPFATARVMASTTASTAALAVLRSPSFSVTTSIKSDLFTTGPFTGLPRRSASDAHAKPRKRSPQRPEARNLLVSRRIQGGFCPCRPGWVSAADGQRRPAAHPAWATNEASCLAGQTFSRSLSPTPAVGRLNRIRKWVSSRAVVRGARIRTPRCPAPASE